MDSLLGKYINYLLMYPVNLLKKNRSEEITKQLYSICFMNTFPQDFPTKLTCKLTKFWKGVLKYL